MEAPTSSRVPGQQERTPRLASPESDSNCDPRNAAGHVTPPRSSLTSDLAENALQSVGENGSPGRGGPAGADDLAAKLDHLHIMQQRPWYLSLLETPPVSASLRPTAAERERDRRMRGPGGGGDLRLRLRSDITPPRGVDGAHEPGPWSRAHQRQGSSSRQRSPLREEELTPETELLREVMGFTSFFSPKDQWLQKSRAYGEEEEVPVDIFHL